MESPREIADLALLAAVGMGARHGKMSMESKAVLVNVSIKKIQKEQPVNLSFISIFFISSQKVGIMKNVID